jgi:hypothetical protein
MTVLEVFLVTEDLGLMLWKCWIFYVLGEFHRFVTDQLRFVVLVL